MIIVKIILIILGGAAGAFLLEGAETWSSFFFLWGVISGFGFLLWGAKALNDQAARDYRDYLD